MQLCDGDACLSAALCDGGSIFVHKHTHRGSTTCARCCCDGSCCFITDCTLGFGPHNHACKQDSTHAPFREACIHSGMQCARVCWVRSLFRGPVVVVVVKSMLAICAKDSVHACCSGGCRGWGEGNKESSIRTERKEAGAATAVRG